MKFFQLSFSSILVGITLLISAHVFADAASIEKEIASIDSSIAARKSSLSAESAKAEAEGEELNKTLRSTEKRLERHQQKVDRAEERMKFVNENIRELDAWFNGLGGIEQGLNKGTYETKKAALNADHSTAQSDFRALQNEKSEMDALIKDSNSKIEMLGKKNQSASAQIIADPQIKSLLSKRKLKEAELAALQKTAPALNKDKNAPPVAPVAVGPVYKSYVYAISGKKSGELEKTLKLKQWVESYQAKYIEANWNDLTGSSSTSTGSMIDFLSQMEKELGKIPKDSKVIIIGYGLGGGAAVLAATEVAAKMNRDIDMLVTLDPMGPGDSRMNAVYQTDAYCQGRISPEQYISCLSSAKKRIISPNVKNFYNRWQRESTMPIDANDRMLVNKREYVLATGKFLVASKNTTVNQKRMYYADKAAHELILSDAAAELPQVLVPFLR